MRTTSVDRLGLIVVLARACPRAWAAHVVRDAARIYREARSAQSYAVCHMGERTDGERARREARARARLAILAEVYGFAAEFGGDPRGGAFSLVFDGETVEVEVAP